MPTNRDFFIAYLPQERIGWVMLCLGTGHPQKDTNLNLEVKTVCAFQQAANSDLRCKSKTNVLVSNWVAGNIYILHVIPFVIVLGCIIHADWPRGPVSSEYVY